MVMLIRSLSEDARSVLSLRLKPQIAGLNALDFLVPLDFNVCNADRKDNAGVRRTFDPIAHLEISREFSPALDAERLATASQKILEDHDYFFLGSETFEALRV